MKCRNIDSNFRVDVRRYNWASVSEPHTCYFNTAVVYIYSQRRLDTRHRTRDYFAFQWPLIDFCAYETGADHAK